MRVTLQQIAERAGVSVSTVSRVMNRRPSRLGLRSARGSVSIRIYEVHRIPMAVWPPRPVSDL